MRDSWNEQLKAYGRSPGAQIGFGQFEEGQVAKWEQGRAELDVNQILAEGIKQPAYAIEAPLRPFNVATGGLVSDIGDFISKVPVLGQAFGAIGGALEASSKFGKGIVNHELARMLAEASGQPDNYSFNLPWASGLPGEWAGKSTITAGEVRREALGRWGMHPGTGEPWNLQQLEARALKDPWDFGEFATDDNGFGDFVNTVLADPLNVAMLGGGTALAGAKAGATVLRSAGWAKPVFTGMGRASGASAWGNGMLRSLGRSAIQTPTGARFADSYTAARAAMEGSLATKGTLAGMMRATSWITRGLYVPGYSGFRAAGMGRVSAGSAAWIRGGIQQQIATNAAEQAAGFANGLLVENGLDNTVLDGFTSQVHDILHKVNNDHPLSDSESFTVVALFSPWARSLGSAVRAPGQLRRANQAPRYTENTLFHIKDEMRKMTGKSMSYDEMLTAFGRGDIEEGRNVLTWWIDQVEVHKAENQITNATRQIVDIEDIAYRQSILRDQVIEDIIQKRKTGALQPKSTAEYSFELIREGPRRGDGEVLAHNMEITPESYFQTVSNLYRANQQFAPELEKLAGLQIEQGAPITRELLEHIRSMVESLKPGERVPRDVASRVMTEGPSLVWESDFWRAFSSTLGQRQTNGRFLRKNGIAEGVTREDLLTQMDSLMDNAPRSSELYHEALTAKRKATKIRPSESLVSDTPYPLPKKIEQTRAYNEGRVRNAVRSMNTLTRMRNAEFFKNGKPRIAAAKQMVGHEGGLFTRTEMPSGTFMVRGSDGAGFTVQNGVLKATALDSETIILGVKNGGRVTIRPVADGPLLAEHGFVESARVKGSDLASYSYRGGDVTRIIENRPNFSAYRATARSANTVDSAAKIAKKQADDASLLFPSMEAIGPAITRSERHMNPAERLSEMNRLIDASRDQYKSVMKQISRENEIAMQLAGIDTKTMGLKDWFDRAYPAQIDRGMNLIKDTNRDYPALSVHESQRIWIDPRESRFSMLLNHRNVYRRLAFDYGHLSPISYIYNGLVAPINARWLGKQTQTEIHNLLAQNGVSADQSRQFVAKMRDEVLQSREVEGLG
jgi:hypothetical protein